MAAEENITELLRAWQQGDQRALERLVPLVRERLWRIAEHHLRGEARGHSWQPSDLVQEAWLKLLGQRFATGQDREHFYSLASRQMRQLLVSYARARKTDKRGGAWLRVAFDEVCKLSDESLVELLPLDEALSDLEVKDPEKVRIVELRYFGGFTVEETARALGLSVATVVRQWNAARAWLKRELGKETTDETAADRNTALETD
jgi:RNA polymerase sigma factor (TIGR02999 family)